VLFDRPHALAAGRLHLDAAGVGARCECVAGDFFAEIPRGAGTYLLKSVLHDWNDLQCATILRCCRDAIGDRGRLLVVERLIPAQLAPTAAHRAIARGDLNMLIGRGGRERTEAEYRSLLDAAGFDVASVTAAGPTFHIVEATPRR
jgi:hypothetical protein